MGDFANASKRMGGKDSQASSSAYASGGTIVGSPIFNNGDDARISAGAAQGSAGSAGASGALPIDFKMAAMVAAAVIVVALIVVKGKRHKIKVVGAVK